MTKRYLIVTMMATHFSRLKKHWKEYEILREEGVSGTNKRLPEFLGGKIVILDWTNKKIIWDVSIDLPTGIICCDNLLFVNSLKNQILGLDKSKRIRHCIKNKNFNSLHSLVKTPRGFLVTSSGTDLILEVDIQGQTLFDWWATDHSFNRTPNGEERILDKSKDHSIEIYPTLLQTTHVNSVVPYGQDNILATLFHQGILIKIDRRTGDYTTLLEGLSNPHAIYSTIDGFLISDTHNNQALILDRNFRVTRKIKAEFKWVQDAIVESGGNFIIADADNNRIVEILGHDEKNSIISTYYFDKEWRVFQIKEISQDQLAEFLKQ